MTGTQRSALVLTASDGAAAGVREDASGDAVEARLRALGFEVERVLTPDDRAIIEASIRAGAARHPLVITTGGTGLTPRDVTPQATLAVVDYEVPGLAEAMRAASIPSTVWGMSGVRAAASIAGCAQTKSSLSRSSGKGSWRPPRVRLPRR